MTNIATPTREAVPKEFFRLRWRFDFTDGRIKYGVWNGASNLESDSAWCVKKDGLLRAVIEGENMRNYSLVTFVEIEGSRYVSAEWIGYARIGNPFAVKHAVTPRTHIGGLSMLTDAEKISVYVNGKVEVRDLTEEEKKFKLHEHK